MRLVSYANQSGAVRAGVLQGGLVVDLAALVHRLPERALLPLPGLPEAPTTMLEVLGQGLPFLNLVAETLQMLAPEVLRRREMAGQPLAFPAHEVRLRAPLPRPPSLRDFYAFEQHVKAARARRGLAMIPEWYQIPVFYFSNVGAIFGPDDTIPYPALSSELDYELEIACVIGRPGVNIPVEAADSYLAGFTILNDWSARDLQRQEMAVGLGPAKGKDFATSLGPWLVTPDELARYSTGDGRYDLARVARVNGREYSRGNLKDITFTFAQMIARASQDCPLAPGDVLGSGTVGTGCIVELGPEQVGGWLRPGDVVELEVEGLGVLRNTVGRPRGQGGRDAELPFTG